MVLMSRRTDRFAPRRRSLAERAAHRVTKHRSKTSASDGKTSTQPGGARFSKRERDYALQLGLGLTAEEDAGLEFDANAAKRAATAAQTLGRKRTRGSIASAREQRDAQEASEGGSSPWTGSGSGGLGDEVFHELSGAAGRAGLQAREAKARGGSSDSESALRAGTVSNLTMQLRKCSNHPFMFGEPKDLAEAAARGG